ncbi:CdaR family transcriptional regulator [Halopolyspora algeriensis]|uniref:CdaR family transcriptional regulator n=1 Tax=Halopolyspora algeriensis TaxID=1500506 RepID=A0A368VYC4_9ACTN|nr:helix-turn-helix domain-containing protein [Halopolyspora algeriensis]RCW45832.1 CdaR family transcriptional regulator [Halopolyspora algeriensis]TQM55247.1 CdaR family transcriptional regulator [Halopolyspora algeriensis]
MAHESASSYAGDRTDSEPHVTVEMLLAEPLLRGCLVGGRSGLANGVTWCLPLSEVDGTSSFPARNKGCDLAGVAIHVPNSHFATGDRAQSLMTRLAQRGASAVLAWPDNGIKTGLDAAARSADTTSIPLLALGQEATFRRIGHLVATKVLAQSAHVLEYSMRVHQALGEVFARGSGLAAMARTMSHLSRTPVLLFGADGEVLAHAGATETEEPPVDVDPAIVTRLITRNGQDRAAASGNGTVPHAHTAALGSQDHPTHAVVAPVTVAGDPYGLVAIVEPVWPADEHDLAQHSVIAEQGATLAGSELLRQRSVHEAEERARDDFVDALLHGRFTDQHELAARSRHYRFDPEGRFAVFVVTLHDMDPERRPDVSRAAAATRAAAELEPNVDMLTLTTQIGSMIVVVRQLPDSIPPQRGEALAESRALRHFAEQLSRMMRTRLGDGVRIVYGRGGTGAAGVADSYREARTTVALGQRVTVPSVCGYDELRVFAAIQEIADSKPGRTFATELLEPLRRADGQTGNLEEIVLAYIKESGNLNAAARRLQLHRNTMLYKLERASRALQMDVRMSETQFMVWLASHIDTLSEVHSALDNELTPPTE